MDTLVLTVDNLESAKTAVKTIKEDGVADDRIRILTQNHKREEAELVDANEATSLELSDVEHSRKRGAIVGALIGTTVGALALSTGGTNMLIIPAGIFLGVGLGALTSQLIGVSEKNPALEAIEHEVQNGKVAVLLDIEHSKHDQVIDHLHRLLPTAKLLESDITGRVARV